MGTRPRSRPARLPAKLLTIRQQLGLSQSEIAAQVGLNKLSQGNARVSEYEHGVREPPLIVLLGYARLAGVCTCVLINDGADLDAQPHKKSRTRSKANAHH